MKRGRHFDAWTWSIGFSVRVGRFGFYLGLPGSKDAWQGYLSGLHGRGWVGYWTWPR